MCQKCCNDFSYESKSAALFAAADYGFKSPLMIQAAALVLLAPDYEGETHHGALMGRYRQAAKAHNMRRSAARLAATIQSGYWPDWLVIKDSALESELLAHCSRLWEAPTHGTTSFPGWYWPWGAGLSPAPDAPVCCD